MEPCSYLKYVLDDVLVVRARVARRPFLLHRPTGGGLALAYRMVMSKMMC